MTMRRLGFLASAAAAALLPAAARAAGETRLGSISYAGRLRDVLMGVDTSAHADLATLGGTPHLWALGPLADLAGEATIMDSRSYTTRVNARGGLDVEALVRGQAGMLVWASVAAWSSTALPATVTDDASLTAHLREAGARQRLGDAFAFRLVGTARTLRFHVLHRPAASGGASPTHEDLQVPFASNGTPVEILGFYAPTLRGIVTQMSTDLHMHVRTIDGTQAGHVDAFQPGEDVRLFLPA